MQPNQTGFDVEEFADALRRMRDGGFEATLTPEDRAAYLAAYRASLAGQCDLLHAHVVAIRIQLLAPFLRMKDRAMNALRPNRH